MLMNHADAQGMAVVCFGEVLWDMLPSGKKIGGAPLNVAYHLNRLGVPAAVASRVGEDKNGADARRFLERNHIPFLLQTDALHSTGAVGVTIAPDGAVANENAGDAPWDFIGFDAAMERAVASARCLVYGSLAARSAVSRRTLFRLLDSPVTRILDINMRPPFYDRDLLEKLMVKADILKMNEEECGLICGMFGMAGSEGERIERLRHVFGPGIILVTRGAAGVTVWAAGEMYRGEGRTVQVVDTVGSGDAFLAGFICARLKGKPLQEALAAANIMGAFVAGRAGGCPDYEVSETGIL
jgi:fructokinase